MNMKQLRYALILHDTGSFSQAAEILGISQPSLSQYIHKIEKELGVTLFDRTTTDIRLTDAGRVYLEAGRKILELERQMHSRISDLQSYRSGSLVVGISPHRCFCIAPQFVQKFRRAYPGMHLVLDERSGRDLMDCAERGMFDLCITVLPVNEQLFSYERLLKEEAVVAVPNDTALCRRLQEAAIPMENRKYPAVDVRMLDGAEFAFLREGMPMQVILENVCRQYDLHLTKVVDCTSNEALEAMVSAGICSAMLPSYLAGYKCNPSTVTCFSLHQEVSSREVVAIYRKGQHLSKPVQDLIAILQSLEV